MRREAVIGRSGGALAEALVAAGIAGEATPDVPETTGKNNGKRATPMTILEDRPASSPRPTPEEPRSLDDLAPSTTTAHPTTAEADRREDA